VTGDGTYECFEMVNKKLLNYDPEARQRITEIQEEVHIGTRNNLINTLRGDGMQYINEVADCSVTCDRRRTNDERCRTPRTI